MNKKLATFLRYSLLTRNLKLLKLTPTPSLCPPSAFAQTFSPNLALPYFYPNARIKVGE